MVQYHFSATTHYVGRLLAENTVKKLICGDFGVFGIKWVPKSRCELF